MLDSPPLVRSPVRTGSSLLVCDVVLVGSFTLPRSPAQADVVVFAMKVSSFGLASSVHSFVQMDVSLLAPASVKAGLFTMTRSFGRVGLAASVLELSHLDPASPLQSFARSEASALSVGLATPGFTSAVPDLSQLEVAMPAQSFSRPEFSLLLSSFSGLGAPLLLRRHMCLGFLALSSGPICLGPSMFAMDKVLFGFLPPLHSLL